MIEAAKRTVESQGLALKLFDRWVRRRQRRAGLEIPRDEAAYKKLGLKNYVNQHAEPRKEHLHDLKEVAKQMSTSDVVALLVMMELPSLEASSLLHKLSKQLAEDPDSNYFSKVNQNDNCGTGCG